MLIVFYCCCMELRWIWFSVWVLVSCQVQAQADTLFRTSTPSSKQVIQWQEQSRQFYEADQPDSAMIYIGLAEKHCAVIAAPEVRYEILVFGARLRLQQQIEFSEVLALFARAKAVLSHPNWNSAARQQAALSLHLYLGEAYDGVNLDSMEHHAYCAYELAQESADSLLIYDALTLLGNVYLRRGPLDHAHAVACFQQAYQLAQKGDFKEVQSHAASNLGVTYLDNDQFAEANRYFHQAKTALVEPIDPYLQTNITYNLAKTYTGLGRQDSAYWFYEQAATLATQSGDTAALVDIWCQQSEILCELQDVGRALRLLKQAEQIAEMSHITQLRFEVQLQLGSLYQAQEMHHRALTSFHVAYGLGHDLLLTDALQALKGMAEAKARVGRLAESHADWKRYVQLTDSLYDRQRTQAVAEMQARFETVQARVETLRLKERQTKDRQIIAWQSALLTSLLGLGCILAWISYRLHQADKQKAQINTKLARFNEEKDMLMRVVAHDLKAPLANIRGLTEFLHYANDLPKDQRHIIHMISTEANRSEELARNLLDLDTIEHAKLSLNLQTHDPVSLFRTLGQRYEKTAAKKQQTIIQPHSTPSLTIETDTGYLSRILDNFVSNAVKYSPNGKPILLQIREVGDKVQFLVQDEGPGLTSADRAKVFQKFAKLSAQPTGGESSTGLGLAISKSLAEKLQGSIWVESEPGEGATFFLELPKRFDRTRTTQETNLA